MPKTRKPGIVRKPPEPSDSHVEIERWARSVMPDLQPIVISLDELIRDTIPGLQYDRAANHRSAGWLPLTRER